MLEFPDEISNDMKSVPQSLTEESLKALDDISTTDAAAKHRLHEELHESFRLRKRFGQFFLQLMEELDELGFVVVGICDVCPHCEQCLESFDESQVETSPSDDSSNDPSPEAVSNSENYPQDGSSDE